MDDAGIRAVLAFKALGNCYMMAKREIARMLKHGGEEISLERWQHVRRFCEDAGLTSSVLRTDDLSAALRTVQEGAPGQETLLRSLVQESSTTPLDVPYYYVPQSLLDQIESTAAACTCRPLTREGVCVTCGKSVKEVAG